MATSENVSDRAKLAIRLFAENVDVWQGTPLGLMVCCMLEAKRRAQTGPLRTAANRLLEKFYEDRAGSPPEDREQDHYWHMQEESLRQNAEDQIDGAPVFTLLDRRTSRQAGTSETEI